ncbi:MAG: hypothetical protein LBR83_01380 [Clostridiales bacterium]|jgi:hypothetical protein|nr:hypothetical protein [Clostridiales bacterium]
MPQGNHILVKLLNKYDKIIAYAFLAASLCWEISSIIFPDMPDNVPMILLAVGLLAFFRSINSALSHLHANVNAVSITDGIQQVVRSSALHKEFNVLANDGIRYYHVLSELGRHIEFLRVAVYDDAQLDKWVSLYTRQLVGKLIVKKMPTRPMFHMCFGESMVLFGGFKIEGGKMSAGTNICIDNTTRDTAAFIECCRTMFNSAFGSSDEVIFNSESPGQGTKPRP